MSHLATGRDPSRGSTRARERSSPPPPHCLCCNHAGLPPCVPARLRGVPGQPPFGGQAIEVMSTHLRASADGVSIRLKSPVHNSGWPIAKIDPNPCLFRFFFSDCPPQLFRLRGEEVYFPRAGGIGQPGRRR